MANDNDFVNQFAQVMQGWADNLEQQALLHLDDVNWPPSWTADQLEEAKFLLTMMLPKITARAAAGMGGLIAEALGGSSRQVNNAMIMMVTANYSKSEAPKIAALVIKENCDDALVQKLAKGYRGLPSMMTLAKESAEQELGGKPSLFSRLANSGKINQSINAYILDEAKKSVALGTQTVQLVTPMVNAMAVEPTNISDLAKKVAFILANR